VLLHTDCVDRGLKPVEKREGGGAHNWGTIADAVAYVDPTCVVIE